MSNDPATSQALKDEVRRLLDQGQKIEAVKRFRKQQQCSLRDALHAVEAIGEGLDVGLLPASPEIPSEIMDEILAAVEKNQKLQAVKIYRDASGKSLRESKEFVESLMAQLGDLPGTDHTGVAQRSGCAGLFLAAVSISAAAAWSVLPG